ncbi:unnamed protein product [Lupinus luteus]|uniref:Uncharacterized protein n=1 Tax=Lupinus luteus TaxID=3873 RepID=A0AAV1YI23_LUPLU
MVKLRYPEGCMNSYLMKLDFFGSIETDGCYFGLYVTQGIFGLYHICIYCYFDLHISAYTQYGNNLEREDFKVTINERFWCEHRTTHINDTKPKDIPEALDGKNDGADDSETPFAVGKSPENLKDAYENLSGARGLGDGTPKVCP